MIDLQPLWKEAERRGLTCHGIAMRAGVHVNTVDRLFQGEHVNTKTLEDVAKALGYKVSLVKRTES